MTMQKAVESRGRVWRGVSRQGLGWWRILAKALQFKGDSAVRSRAAEAMVHMKSDDAVDALVGALDDSYPYVHRDAATALGQLGRRRAVEPLKNHLADAHAPTRLAIVEALHALGEPFRAEWVMPMIKSKDPAFQNAIWFVRRNAGTNAAACLIDCLDVENPSVTNYYNYTLTWQIHACGGPKLTYHHDFQKEGTPDQIEQNRRTLQALVDWRRASETRH